MRRKLALAVAVISMMMLSGCWDRIEVEELGYVVAIGIDKGKAEGRISVTLQIENPQVGSSDRAKAENEPSHVIITFDAPDILSAQDLAESDFARRTTFSHTEAIILGEEFARSSECLETISDLLRNRELRSQINLIVSREKASEFIRRNMPPMETRLHKFYTLVSDRWAETGFTPKSTMHRYIQRTEQDESLFLAIYGTTYKGKGEKYGNEDEYLPGETPIKGGNPVQFIGSAVFKEGSMIGTLTGEETRMVTMIRNDYPVKEVKVTFTDPVKSEYRVIANLSEQQDTDVKMKISGDKPYINVNMYLLANIIDIPSHVPYVQDTKMQELLKNNMEDAIEKEAMDLIEKTQREFGADPFVWGVAARKKFLTQPEFVKYDWMKKYPNAEVSVKCHIRIKAFGKELNPVPLEKVRD